MSNHPLVVVVNGLQMLQIGKHFLLLRPDHVPLRHLQQSQLQSRLVNLLSSFFRLRLLVVVLLVQFFLFLLLVLVQVLRDLHVLVHVVHKAYTLARRVQFECLANHFLAFELLQLFAEIEVEARLRDKLGHLKFNVF